MTGHLSQSPSGKWLGLATFSDMSLEKASEEALRNSEENYRRLFDSAPIAYVASQSGFIKDANPMASEMMGYSLDELIGMPSENLFVDREDSKLRRTENLNRFERGLPDWDTEQRMLRKNGQELIVRHRGQVSLDPSGQRTGPGDIHRYHTAKRSGRGLAAKRGSLPRHL